MYIPHKDMYGYIKTISMNHQIAGDATMTIMLDTIRKRPIFPSQRPAQGTQTPQPNQTASATETILTTQPNLVMKWTSGAPASSTPAGQSSARVSSTGDTPSSDPSVNLVNNPATLLRALGEPVYQQQVALTDYRKSQVGTEWGTRSDTKSRCFRVQKDTDGSGGTPFFTRATWLGPTGAAPASASAPFGINSTYFQKILTYQPYTDEQGYEVVGVFPLGRWKSLIEAYKETREGKLVSFVSPEAATLLNATNAALFAGLSCPSSESSAVLLAQFNRIRSDITNYSSFELDWTQPNAPATTNPPQPDSVPAKGSDLATATALANQLTSAVNVFLTGTPAPSASTLQEIKIALENNANTVATNTNNLNNLLTP
jgi:hypothetical protein